MKTLTAVWAGAIELQVEREPEVEVEREREREREREPEPEVEPEPEPEVEMAAELPDASLVVPAVPPVQEPESALEWRKTPASAYSHERK